MGSGVTARLPMTAELQDLKSSKGMSDTQKMFQCSMIHSVSLAIKKGRKGYGYFFKSLLQLKIHHSKHKHE